MLLEIASFNLQSALIAQKAGADRIELCDNPNVGGTTPDYATFCSLRDQFTIPIFIMIRPRGGDFVYSDAEFEQMKIDISRFKALANGFVFGSLRADNRVDTTRTKELVHLARPLPCTFHRAFDETHDQYEALEDIIGCGCTNILTSGGATNALAGSSTLQQLILRAKQRICIIPGGGVRSSNLERLKQETSATTFHSSAILNDVSVASANEIQQLKAYMGR